MNEDCVIGESRPVTLVYAIVISRYQALIRHNQDTGEFSVSVYKLPLGKFVVYIILYSHQFNIVHRSLL